MTIPTWNLDDIQNVGHTLTETAFRMPDATAVAAARKSRRNPIVYDQITFLELEQQSNQIASGMQKNGISKGCRIALMVPPGVEFVLHVFALFKAGANIILIDPGMGRKNMIRCLSEAKPQGIIGIPLAQIARVLFRKHFPQSSKNFVAGRKFWPGCKSTLSFLRTEKTEFSPIDINREDEAAIIFTTGSTGPPKGVLYRHRIFIEQAKRIRDYFAIQPGTVDVSGFPLFALFNTAMGTTTVFPRMDPTRPAEVHPPDIIDAVRKFNANQSFGSPALWNTVSKFCEKEDVKLPMIERILSAGAPVPPTVLARIKSIISPEGDAFTPYGATEALPIACNSATVVIGETAAKTNLGAGTCVGHKFPGINWQVIEISDSPIEKMDLAQPLPSGEIGELIVQGDVVTDQYVTRTAANAEHKITDGEKFWHRMGDVGYFDELGRFWFCGRKSHRVRAALATHFTVPCEAIFNTHPAIYRSALVGVGEPGKQLPVMIVETQPESFPKSKAAEDNLKKELFMLAAGNPMTNMIQLENILVHQKLPTDIRHNSKIFREQLRVWAAKQLGW